MPTAKVRIWPFSGAVPMTVCGAGNSKLPLMKQTGNWQWRRGSGGLEGRHAKIGQRCIEDDDAGSRAPRRLAACGGRGGSGGAPGSLTLCRRCDRSTRLLPASRDTDRPARFSLSNLARNRVMRR